jgi:putative molybdopterin biosynthesis protein
VAKLLNINEKMVYTLIHEKGLPATKITGKWLFPRHLVEQLQWALALPYAGPKSMIREMVPLLVQASGRQQQLYVPPAVS